MQIGYNKANTWIKTNMEEMGRDHEDDNDIEEYNNKYDL